MLRGISKFSFIHSRPKNLALKGKDNQGSLSINHDRPRPLVRGSRRLILFTVLFLSGCATMYNPATGRNEFIFLNSPTEVALGLNVQEELLKKYPLLHDRQLQARVETVGRRLASASDRQDVQYKFYVLEDKELNAMALPGGFIYVNNGLMQILNDDELAYVLGHEVGHVAARHTVKKIQANMAYQLVLGIAFASVGENAGASAQNLAQGVDTVYNLVSLGYSRQDEYEADRIGAKYSFHSGYNPYAALSALEKIKKAEGPNWKILGYFRSHPFADERIEALKKAIPKITGAEP